MKPRPLPSKKECQQRFDTIQSIVRAHWLDAGRLLKEGLERQDWKTMGFANVREWLDAATFGSVSSAWKALRIAKALEHVPDATMKRITEGKADLIARLPKEERQKDEWITDAADPRVSTKEMRAKVSRFFDKGTASEPFADFHLRVPEGSYRNIIEPAIDKAARLLNIDLEMYPQKRCEVFEKICLFVLITEDYRFVVEAVGDVNSPTVSWSAGLMLNRTRQLTSADKQLIRRQVYERDGHRCVDCGKFLEWLEFHLHHKKERSLGGTWELENLVTLCPPCHAKYKG